MAMCDRGREKVKSQDTETKNDSSTTPAFEPVTTSTEELVTMPRPYFPDSGARQPPVIPIEGEQRLENIKSKILTLYRGIRKKRSTKFQPCRDEGAQVTERGQNDHR